MSEMTLSIYNELLQVGEHVCNADITEGITSSYMFIEIPQGMATPSASFMAAYLINGSHTHLMLNSTQLHQFNTLVTTARENWRKLISHSEQHKALQKEVINAR